MFTLITVTFIFWVVSSAFMLLVHFNDQRRYARLDAIVADGRRQLAESDARHAETQAWLAEIRRPR